MENKPSKISAILTIVAAAALIGFMIMFRFLRYDLNNENIGAAFIIFLFGAYGAVIIYVSSIPFALVALIFGIIMLKQRSTDRLISFHKRMLIAACILLPFVMLGLSYVGLLFYMSAIIMFQGIYTVFTAAAYLACLISQIVAIVKLKKSPVEPDSTVFEPTVSE